MCDCKECGNPPCQDVRSADKGTHVMYENCDQHQSG